MTQKELTDQFHEFSQLIAEDIRMILRHLGKVREDSRNIRYEIGCFLCLKSKYGPGGDFDPEWKPTNFAPLPNPIEDPTDILNFPDDRPTTGPPAWRTIHTKRRRKIKPDQTPWSANNE
ncbi:hypothetical protein CPB86DRAFT_786284 [Serendipita vermifera]|nr:hypothetical protein CPB86DRAFT_786284 [Serendipita vermifera]